MWQVVLTWLMMIIVGFAVYYAYTRWMPSSWRAVAAGWKTQVTGAFIAFAPDVMSLLSMIQAVGDQWVMSPTVEIFMRGVGVVMIVLRWITSFEQEEKE